MDKIEEQNINREPNSKINYMQRLAGGLIDLCLIFLSFWGLVTLFMNTGMADTYKSNAGKMQEIRDQYRLDSGVANKVTITEENKEQYSTYKIYEGTYEDGEKYNYVVVNKKEISQESIDLYNMYIKEDKVYQNLRFDNRFMNYGINVLAGFIVTSIFLVVVPLLNQRRVSIGGLFSEQRLFSLRYESTAHWYHIVLRYLFMFIFEMALPYLYFELFTFILVPVVFFLVGTINKNGRTFHDFITRTKFIDNKTFTPLVPIDD